MASVTAFALAVFAQPRAPSQPASAHHRTFNSRLAGGEVSSLICLPPAYEKQPAQR